MPALLLWDVDHTIIENGGVSKVGQVVATESLFDGLGVSQKVGLTGLFFT